jgi:hypothetical protein
MIQLLIRQALRLPVLRRGGDWGVSLVSETKGPCWRIIQVLSGQPSEARRPGRFRAVAEEPRADSR